MINKTYYNNGRRHAYLYPVDEVRYKEPEDLYIFFRNYEEYRKRVEYIKESSTSHLSYFSKKSNIKLTISDIFLTSEKDSIVFGLCNHYQDSKRKKLYGQFNVANYKCPLMRKHILEMNQEQLDRFIDLQNITKCNNEKMCSVYDAMPKSDNIYNRKIDIESQHQFSIEKLNYLKNYTLKT